MSNARTLLWPSSGRVEYSDVPADLEQSLQRDFPDLRIAVARTEQEFLRELPDCEILIAMKIKPEQFALCRKLRWIHSPMAGVTPLLVPALVSSDVIVTNGRSVHSVPVAEQTLAILFALARRLPICVRLQAERRWGQDDFWQAGQRPFELQGKTLGLVGLGAIGHELAPRARALGMRVLAVRRNPSKGGEFVDRVYPSTALHEMLPEADFVVLILPDTPENLHIIGAPEFAKMKRSAYLINMARGPLVDTNARRSPVRDSMSPTRSRCRRSILFGNCRTSSSRRILAEHPTVSGNAKAHCCARICVGISAAVPCSMLLKNHAGIDHFWPCSLNLWQTTA